MIHATFSGKRFIRYALTLLTCILLLLIVFSIALARPFRLGRLPDKGENFGCKTCHITPGGQKNVFGQDYDKIAVEAGDKYTTELGKIDSDGDGFINDEEFADNTNPGDPESRPPGEAVAKTEGRIEGQKKHRFHLHEKIYDTGRYLGIAGFILILIQYVLSSRIRLIEKRAGLDKLFIVHRKTGMLGAILIFLHPISLFVYNGLDGYDLRWKIVGITALVMLLGLAAVATLYPRLKLNYDTWKKMHRTGYVLFPLVFVHSIFLGSDLYGWSPLKIDWLIFACIYVIIIIYKLWNMIGVRRRSFKVADVVKESHDVTSLYFEGEHRDYIPGQFMLVQLIRGGKVSKSHPFTISSSPTRDKLAISAKSVGDFTATIGDTKVSDGAYIDAPYGKFSFLNHDDQDFVFIAGGIGVTPFMSMLRYMYDKKLERNITLIWGNKTEADIVFREELEKMSAEMPSLKVVHVMSKQEDWPGEKGYVDEAMLKKHISNFQAGQFFLCGPPVMMNLLEKTLRKLGVTKKRIHYERFALR